MPRIKVQIEPPAINLQVLKKKREKRMTVTKENAIIDAAVESELEKDPVGAVTLRAIREGLAEINKANETLLESDDRTKVSDIDKALKEGKSDGKALPKNILAAAKKAADARETFKKAQEEARNLYRVEVLKEEAKEDSDVDKEAVQDTRKLVMESLKFLDTYARTSKRTNFAEWAAKVSVPQVGRQGSSSTGAKKPRVYVKVDETVYDSFTLAAAGLSTKKQKVTASELAEAWNTATGGTEGSFEFKSQDDDGNVVNHTFVITNKPKKSDKK